MAILQQLEPMIVHLLQKFTLDWVSRDRTDDRIDATFGAECRVVIIGPMFDLTRREHFQTIEAPANIARCERFTMVA